MNELDLVFVNIKVTLAAYNGGRGNNLSGVHLKFPKFEKVGKIKCNLV